ncbi:hypothetical protein [Streptomyces chilikensis]|uniref:hypothetical protein n=1 Tax=Streptomyces chilikensis TaxID=1194079 RepID=UPI000B1F17A5|nr:hypothetical protein [Streptomyces chilikensis]
MKYRIKRRFINSGAALGGSLIFAIGVTAGAPVPASATGSAGTASSIVCTVVSQPSQTVTVRVVRLTEFKQLEGKPAWVDAEQQRLLNSVWQFNPDGTFAWSTEGMSNELLPIQGTYTVSGSQWSFTGYNSIAIGGSSTFVEISGTFDVSRSTMTLAVASGAGYGAVVNGQEFGSTASSAYQGAMDVTTE